MGLLRLSAQGRQPGVKHSTPEPGLQGKRPNGRVLETVVSGKSCSSTELPTLDSLARMGAVHRMHSETSIRPNGLIVVRDSISCSLVSGLACCSAWHRTTVLMVTDEQHTDCNTA